MKKSWYAEGWTVRERRAVDAALQKIRAAQDTEHGGAFTKYDCAFQLEQTLWAQLACRPEDSFANWIQKAAGLDARRYTRFAAARGVLAAPVATTLGAFGVAELGRLVHDPRQLVALAQEAADLLRQTEQERQKKLGPGLIVATVKRVCRAHGIVAPKRAPALHASTAPFIEILRKTIAMTTDVTARAFMQNELANLGIPWQREAQEAPAAPAARAA